MKGPVAKRLFFAKHLLGEFPGVTLIGRVDLERALTNFRFPAVLAKHILHELNDKP